MRARFLAVLLSALSLPLPAQHGAHPIGTVRFPISCAPETRAPFARGVALVHSFAFGAATAAFTDVLRRDPQCAMASCSGAIRRFIKALGHRRNSAKETA